MISIIDYGSGNIRAIQNIYNRLNIESQLISSPDELDVATKIILPGVGAFDETMKQLGRSGMLDKLNERVLNDKVPVLGVCVGMQVMAKSSEEGQMEGLGWFDATVKKINPEAISHKPKLPHMGWNSISPSVKHSVFKDVDFEKGFYFLHSYYFQCNDSSDILSTTSYGNEFTSSVNRNNIFGFQFHPEKSHQNGINLFKNFAELD